MFKRLEDLYTQTDVEYWRSLIERIYVLAEGTDFDLTSIDSIAGQLTKRKWISLRQETALIDALDKLRGNK